MEPTTNLIIFTILGIVIMAMSVLAVASKKMLRSVVYLFFTLIGTAGLYLFLNYHFLAAVQISVYAGGIVVLFIFAIFLINSKGEVEEPLSKKKMLYGAFTALAGVAVTFFVLFKHKFLYDGNTSIAGDQEINMKVIGEALLGTGKFQYILPFEVLSVLLLACIVGGILIARKR